MPLLAIDLNTNLVARLHLYDTVSHALKLMSENHISHLPVVDEDKYLGLITEDDLIDVEDKNITIEQLQDDLINVSVLEGDHFLQAVNLANQYQIPVIPIVDKEHNYIGAISSQTLLTNLGSFAGAQEPGGIIVLEMERNKFAMSEISRIVENNDCLILHLNTVTSPQTGLLLVTLRINKRELAIIVASFERYDYDVVYYLGEEKFENEIHSNYLHLMNYLDI